MSLTLPQITKQLRELKVVPVIALDRAEDILPLADTLANNGLSVAVHLLLQKLFVYYANSDRTF